MAYTVCKEEQRKNRKRGQAEKMKYDHITEGRFIDRPNRFIAHRPYVLVYINFGYFWAGGNGSCKEYRQVQGIFGPGYTKACFY